MDDVVRAEQQGSGRPRPVRREHPEPGRNVIWWAVGGSVLLHLLLALLSWWMPFTSSAAEPEPQQDSELTFTFAEAPEADTTEPPRGEVQAPTQPTPVPQPPPQPETPPAPQLDPVPTPPALEPTPEPLPEQIPDDPQPQGDPEQPEQPPEEPVEEEPNEIVDPVERPEEAEQPQDPGDQGLPSAEQGRSIDAADPGPQETRPEPPRKDWNGALESFRQRVNSSRSAVPPPPQSGSNRSTFVPDASNLPAPGAPFGILEFSSRDYDWSDYASQIYYAILYAWYNRLYLTTADFEKWAHQNRNWQLQHDAKISFVIIRSGDVVRIQLLEGSGCGPLDQSALDALSEVVLPPLPADFPRDEELVRARFIARGQVQHMRTMFSMMKARGIF